MNYVNRSERNGFGALEVERQAEKRNDSAWIDEQLGDATARFLPLWRLQHLCRPEQPPRPVFASCGDLGELLSKVESLTFLGRDGAGPLFAAALPDSDGDVPNRLDRLGCFFGLRELAPLLAESDSAVLAYARAVVFWHSRHRFCGECGAPTASAAGGHLRVCTNEACASEQFPRTDPAIIVLVADGPHALLGRQAQWPRGMYSTIAGFVEPGESLERAVAREVQEETGVSVDQIEYHSSQPWPFPGSIMLGFTATARTTQITLNDQELEDARWFSRRKLAEKARAGTIRLPAPYSIAYRLVEHWFDAGDEPPLATVAEEAARRVKG